MICGNHIRLRGVERSDLPAFQKWLNDPEVTEGLSTYLPLSRIDEEQWLDGMSRMQPDEKPLAI